MGVARRAGLGMRFGSGHVQEHGKQKVLSPSSAVLHCVLTVWHSYEVDACNIQNTCQHYYAKSMCTVVH